MTAKHCATCTCSTSEERPGDNATIAALMRSGWPEQEARDTVLGWYDDEDRMGYEEGHVCCPDCGCDPNDHTLHDEGCRRAFPHDYDGPLLRLQFGPPWEPWPVLVPGSVIRS